MNSRIISHRLPSCPGRDSRFTLRHNTQQPQNPFWVFYESPTGDLIAADDPHPELVELVNALKTAFGNQAGGSFSINEHSQVIARMAAPAAAKEKAHHVIASDVQGVVRTYKSNITFASGRLDPAATPQEGAPWLGPLCGMTYTFAAPQNPKPPSRNLDEIWMEVEGSIVQLSKDAGGDPYPPSPGVDLLANFLVALRRYLPTGGRVRVNERGRAFTSDSTTFVGIVPVARWFKPLTSRA